MAAVDAALPPAIPWPSLEAFLQLEILSGDRKQTHPIDTCGWTVCRFGRPSQGAVRSSSGGMCHILHANAGLLGGTLGGRYGRWRDEGLVQGHNPRPSRIPLTITRRLCSIVFQGTVQASEEASCGRGARGASLAARTAAVAMPARAVAVLILSGECPARVGLGAGVSHSGRRPLGGSTRRGGRESRPCALQNAIPSITALYRCSFAHSRAGWVHGRFAACVVSPTLPSLTFWP